MTRPSRVAQDAATADPSTPPFSLVMDALRADTDAGLGEDLPWLSDDAMRDAAGNWWRPFLRAVRGSGISATHFSGSVQDAVRAAASGVTVVTRRGTSISDEEWILIRSRRGKEIQVQQIPRNMIAAWIPEGQLEQQLDPNKSRIQFDWVVVRPVVAGNPPHADVSRHHLRPFARLIELLRPEFKDIRTVFLFAVGVGILTLATPITVEALVNTVAFGSMQQQLLVLSLILLFCLSLAAALRAFQTYVVEIIQQRIFVRVAGDLAHRLPRVRLEAYDGHHGPELVNRFFEVLTVQKVVSGLLLDGVAIVLQTAISLVVLAFYHPFLLGFDIVLLFLIALVIFGLGRGAVKSSIRESKAKYAVAGWLEELARYPQAFKFHEGRNLALQRADEFLREYVMARKAHFRIVYRQIVAALALQAAASTILLGLGGWLVISGQLTLGQLVAAELIVTIVVASFAKLGKHMEAYYDLLAGVDKLGHLTDLELEPTGGEMLPPSASGAVIVAHHVSYEYSEGDGSHNEATDNHVDPASQVAQPLNLTLTSCERVALMGSTGSGKSTLVDLLVALRQPNQGWVTIDGADFRDLNLDTIRSQLAWVSEIETVEGTVLDNVCMGREYLTITDVRDALKQVGLLDKVLEMPGGIQTRLSTGGRPLSRSESLRLMIARCIISDPRFLILDEVLDALHLEPGDPLLECLFGKDASWTLLIVTNDSEIAALCDRTLRLEKGQLSIVNANG